MITEGREDELLPIAAEIARGLKAPEAIAHAELAARLAARAGPWQGARQYVELAFAHEDPNLWALREMEAHAALAEDARASFAASKKLAEQSVPPTRGGHALPACGGGGPATCGDRTAAADLLRRALEAEPSHLVAQRTLAELAASSGDFRTAADAYETVATLSSVTEHQVIAHYEAAVLFLDRLNDAERGRAVLETIADIDVAHRDVFTRLQGLYLAAGDRGALASLLEKRLAKVRDPSERVELEIVRGRTLAEIGDRDAAKRALAFALEASPDHVDALEAFADLCAREEDWTGAEQSLIRLVRLVPDPEEQAALYTRLGDLYDRHQPNPERAELAYREVLRRIPNDVNAQERLVEIYRRAGDAPKAIETQQVLLQAAPTPDVRRRRTIELARIYETAAGDLKKSEAMLDAARKEFPTDVELLVAVAELYRRTNRGPAVQMLLDRAAGDARRALSTGRFDVGLFAMLGAVARLRDRVQAADIAEATVHAPSKASPRASPEAGARAGDARFDDLVAPDVLQPRLPRAPAQVGRGARRRGRHRSRNRCARPRLPQQTGHAAAEIKELGAALGLTALEVFVSPALGTSVMPVGSHPPQIVIGASLLASPEDGVRRFWCSARSRSFRPGRRTGALCADRPIAAGLGLPATVRAGLAVRWRSTPAS